MPGRVVKKESGRKRTNKPKHIAIAMLVKGPAKETFRAPHFWSLKLYGLTGTGFAQPTNIGLPMKNKKTGNKIEPNKSKCGIGFKVRRPAYFAVGSPRELATYPCANSWMMTENNKTTKEKILITISINVIYHLLQKKRR